MHRYSNTSVWNFPRTCSTENCARCHSNSHKSMSCAREAQGRKAEAGNNASAIARSHQEEVQVNQRIITHAILTLLIAVFLMSSPAAGQIKLGTNALNVAPAAAKP